MGIEKRRRELGERLRNARVRAIALRNLGKEQNALTQARAARAFGISQSFLSKIERGEQEPGFLLVEKMCAYYGSQISKLSTYDEGERARMHFTRTD